jgi:hypothetical protein
MPAVAPPSINLLGSKKLFKIKSADKIPQEMKKKLMRNLLIQILMVKKYFPSSVFGT